MNLPFFIAKRYILSKKSTNVINIISAISILGVAVGTMSLIIVLSVFNGFDSLIKSLFSSFDPDLKITVVEGKTFNSDSIIFDNIKKMESIKEYVEVLEENAFLIYDEKNIIATVKGVSDNFSEMNGIDSMIYDGDFILKDDVRNYAVVGYGIAYNLSIGLNFASSLNIWIPKRKEKITFEADKAFNNRYIQPSGIFSVQQEYDNKYVIVPIDFAREMLEYDYGAVSSVEIKIDESYDIDAIKKQIQNIIGNNFEVKNRYQQHELLYKIMKSEKWAIFLILSFILIILSFNVIGSLTMLIIDKKKDILILRNIGADDNLIKKIFILEGWLISAIGAVIGLILGALICFLQQKFSFIQFPSTGTFIINAYPVRLQALDFIYTLITVFAIGFIVAWYPVRYITKKHLT
jgi:lipoprotein-releasing system permease protein